MSDQFADHEFVRNRYDMPPKSWWAIWCLYDNGTVTSYEVTGSVFILLLL